MNFKIRILKGKQELLLQRNGKTNDICTHFGRKYLGKLTGLLVRLNLIQKDNKEMGDVISIRR